MYRNIFFIAFFFLMSRAVDAQPLTHYRHNNFWGRIILSDRISDQLKWEVYLQYRTQNDEDNKWNMFKHHQLTSYWLWLHYQPAKDLRISVTPFCYFNTIALFPQPADQGNRGVKELRWAVQAEHTQRLRYFNFSNRYGIEYRYRDLKKEDVFEPNYRVRYRAKLERPIQSGKHPASVILYDEVFLEFGKGVRGSPAVFNQNRVYAGVSYDVLRNVKFTLGYMYVIQERPTGAALDFSNVLWGMITFDNLFSQFARSGQSEPAKKSP